jgi:hypothetical protein
MPGFGGVPFGVGGFGEGMWEGTVLYETAPDQYKEDDRKYGSQWLTWTRGVAESFKPLRRKITKFGDLQNPLAAQTSWDATQTLLLGRSLLLLEEVEQAGFDGALELPSAVAQFYSASARFAATDVGKALVVRGSVVNPAHNGVFTIIAWVDEHRVVLDPNAAVLDVGPLGWELRTVSNADHAVIEIRGGYIGEVNPGYSIWDEVGSFAITGRRLFDAQGRLLSEVRLRGTALTVSLVGTETWVTDPAAAFVPTDAGKPFIYRGTSTGGAVAARVKRYESATTLVLDCAPEYLADPFNGRFEWELRSAAAFAQVDLEGTVIPSGVLEQEGTDMVTNGVDGTVYAASARFTADSVGKMLSIFGGSDPNIPGNYRIVSFVDVHTVVVDVHPPVPFPPPPPPWGIPAAVDLIWELRAVVHRTVVVGPPADVLYDAQVLARPPSMLQLLGNNANFELDERETEVRQRNWVRSLSEWVQLKGTPTGYIGAGELSGFDVSVYGLYHVTPQLALSGLIPVADVCELALTGRYGADGELFVSGAWSACVLSTPTGGFIPGDEGRVVRLTHCTTAANNRLFFITRVLDANTVQLSPLNPATLPDYGVGGSSGSGAVNWVLVEFYVVKIEGSSLYASLRPRFDEFNADMMWVEQQALGLDFPLDVFCWETGIGFTLDVTIPPGGVTQLSLTSWEVTITGANAEILNTPLGSPQAIWSLTDSAGTPLTVYMDTLVDIGGGARKFTTMSRTAPVVGPAVVTYLCNEEMSCDYCKTYKVLCVIEAGDILLDSGISIEMAANRLIRRFEDELLPAHAALYPRILTRLEVPGGGLEIVL